MDTPVFEVNKDISVTPMMQLVDLNGTKVNFQSEFTISSKDPSKKVMVAIVNQDQLDNGEIRFEPTEDGGKYSRRITFQQNRHLNHFIALKKIDKEETPVECTITVRLRELEESKESNESKDNNENNESKDNKQHKKVSFQPEAGNSVLNGGIDSTTRDQLQHKLSNLRQSPEYYKSPDTPPPAPPKKIVVENRPLTFHEKLRADPYYLVGIITLLLFVIILSYKFMRR
jgi:hypothetical protein